MAISRTVWINKRQTFSKLRPNTDKPAGKFGSQRPRGTSKFLPFVPRLGASVELGRTTASFRLQQKPYHPKVGELFDARCNGRALEGKYRCTTRKKITYEEMRTSYWRLIGLGSREAYEDVMDEIYQGNVPKANQPGILFIFERIE